MKYKVTLENEENEFISRNEVSATHGIHGAMQTVLQHQFPQRVEREVIYGIVEQEGKQPIKLKYIICSEFNHIREISHPIPEQLKEKLEDNEDNN